jgi:hypothetical protein
MTADGRIAELMRRAVPDGAAGNDYRASLSFSPYREFRGMERLK